MVMIIIIINKGLLNQENKRNQDLFKQDWKYMLFNNYLIS